MTLRKRYVRNLKQNLSFYLCAMVLTALVVVLYIAFAAGCVIIRQNLDDFYADAHVEDAQFTTLVELSDADIRKLEEKYDIIAEKQTFIDFEDADYTVRVMKNTTKVNLSRLSAGEDISADDEILLNTGLMKENGLSYGDMVNLSGESFTLVGDFERPDFLFPIRETTDTFAMTKEFGIAVVSDAAYRRLRSTYGESGIYYSVIYNRDNADEVRKKINEDYHMLSCLKAGTNTRINTPINTMEQAESMTDMVVFGLILFITVIIAVVLGRKIKHDRKQIGVLLALGYRKRELAWHYAFFGLVPGICGSVLGVILSELFADDMVGVMFYKFEPLPVQYRPGVPDVVAALLVPALCYIVAVYLSAKKVMKTDVITMISGRSAVSGKSGLRMKKSRLSVRTKYKLRQILGKPGRSIIVVIGLAFGGMLYAFCAACIDSMDDYVKHTVAMIGDFEYEYFLKTVQQGEPEEGSAILGASFEVKDREDVIMLLGIDSPKYINFSDPGGNALEYDKEHYYITSMASLAFGVGKGDDIRFVDPISLEEYTVTITDIVKNDSQSAIYCSRENAGKLLDIPSDCYNIIMSDKALDLDEAGLAKTISKTSLAEQIEEVKTQMENIVEPLNVFAVFICVIVVYMMVNVLVSESAPSVSMLKVLGYRNREINSMVINVYHLLVPIAIFLSFLLGFFGTKMVFDTNVSVYKTRLATLIYPASVIKLILLVGVSYVFSLFLLRRKVDKADMVESLKDNRE